MGLMDKQTQQAFALGGLKDEGGEIDEASGNRVPIGGTKEGVRDDIPANVSEGEFIFPADVVRYHGLDKMMALRQEAKMGLRKMESMGQMGNSEEASMPDDLPFEMADLIVVGGQGEPMEFANGGFVPQMQTLQTAAVPTMGGPTGNVTPIVYDDFAKAPVVTMQEYRNAAGESIIITSVNGKATTEIPSGYTLYVPPTNAAPTATQAVIQTANNYSYQTSGGDEGPDTPRELQVDPDYASMDNDTYFSTMERQNSFGGKAGNAAAMGIALALGPLGLLTMGMLQADKKRQLTSAEQRIASETNPTKKKAYQATFTKMGGKTKEPEEENALVKFGKGFVAAVSGLFGLGNDDVEKVASVAGSAAADNTNAPAVKQATNVTQVARQSPVAPVASQSAEAPSTAQDKVAPKIPPSSFQVLQPTQSLYTGIKEPEAIVTSTPPTANPALVPNDGTFPVASQVASPSPEVAVNASFDPNQLRGEQLVKPKQQFSSYDNGMVDMFGNPYEDMPMGMSLNSTRNLPIPNIESPATQADVQPVAQAAGTPTAGYDRQPVNRAEFERGARGTVDFFGSTEQFQARELLNEAYADENNLPGSTYNLEAALINRYGFEQLQNAGLLNDKQIYARPSLLKDGSFRPDKIEGSEILADGVTPVREAAKSQVFFDGSKYPKEISPLMTPAPQPAPAIERPVTQTDAALGAQTEYGRRIANAKGDNFIPQSNVDVAGLSDYVPDFLKRAATNRVTPTFNEGAIQAQGLLERQALKDSPDMFGPEVSPFPTTPRADPVDDPLGANAQAAAVTETGISREPTGFRYVPQVNNKQVVADELREESLNMPSQIQQAPAIIQQADPRQAFADNRVYSSPREEADKRGLSESELTLGRARNVATMPDPYVASLNSAFGRSSVEDQTKSIFDTDYVDPYAGDIVPTDTVSQTTTTPTSTTVADEAALVAQENARLNAKPYSKRTKPSDAARTSKGTGTRKAAPTGDDRLSQANFLERALGITPAKVSARRGNDGVLYRTQADKREADNRQEQAKTTQRASDRAKTRREAVAAGKSGDKAVEDFNKANAADIEKRHGGDKENSSGKIVCSAMNNAYGFGSFRNKIWLEHSKNNLTKEHQVGYHRMFLPLIHLGYNKDYKFIRKCLEHIARHRTADIYFQSKSNKRNTLGMVYRTILEPICYLVGMFPTSKDNK